MAHLRLFSVIFAGGALVVSSQPAMKPTPVTEPSAGTVWFQLAFVMVTAGPLWVKLAFQPLPTLWPFANCHRTFQPLIGVRVRFVMVASTWSCPDQVLV